MLSMQQKSSTRLCPSQVPQVSGTSARPQAAENLLKPAQRALPEADKCFLATDRRGHVSVSGVLAIRAYVRPEVVRFLPRVQKAFVSVRGRLMAISEAINTCCLEDGQLSGWSTAVSLSQIWHFCIRLPEKKSCCVCIRAVVVCSRHPPGIFLGHDDCVKSH